MAGLYIHVPFCTKRCLYCDFYSNTDMSYKKAYINALCREMEIRKNYIDEEPIRTVYLGGGTPSQLDIEDLTSIFDAIYQHFDLSQCKEITLEGNPDDMTDSYVRDLASLPINRISMGVQSLKEKDLKFLNRRHDRTEALDAIRRCQDHGFQNLSIDLIYGLPGQTLQEWEENLSEVTSLHIPHISAYHLIYEEGTPLYKLMNSGRINPVDEELSVKLFATLIDHLQTAGYEHYEISNFARPGCYSKHNSSYWTGEKYLGLGPSAHSYNIENRQWNIASLPIYIKGMTNGKPEIELEELDTDTRYNDLIITRLRTMWGLPLDIVREQFGEERVRYLLGQAAPHLKQKVLELETESNTLRLTRAGIFISDGIMSDLLWV